MDPDAWAKLFVEAGAHHVVLTAEHHAGYANWDSEFTPWNSFNIGPKRDLVGDLGEAVGKQGLRPETVSYTHLTLPTKA